MSRSGWTSHWSYHCRWPGHQSKHPICLLVRSFDSAKILGTYSSIAVPDVHVNLRNRLAGLGVDQLNIEEKGDTLLVLCDVRPDHFTSNI